MTACFIVRAELSDLSVKDEFDRWYEYEHFPDAKSAFGARRAWRGWSDEDPAVHYAVYEFADVAAARAVPGSDALARLVADFDRTWGDGIVRIREVLDITQIIGD